MHLQKLTKVLQALKAEEFKRLSTYVRSPYFKVPAIAHDLFVYLEKQHPQWTDRKLNPAAIARKCPRLDSKKLQAKAGTLLLLSTEQFLAIEQLNTHTTAMRLYLLEQYKNHHLFEQFTELLSQTTRQLSQAPEPNFNTFYELHLCTELGFNNFNALQQRKTPGHIAEVISTLDTFYALKKLRYLCEALHRHRIFNQPPPPHRASALLKTLQAYTHTGCPYVYLFAHAYRLFSAATYTAALPGYRAIKSFVSTQPATSLTAEISEILPYVASHCQYWVNKGIAEAGREQLWWLEYRMQHGQLLINGKLLPTTFCNMAVLYLQHGQPGQLQQFINTYSPCLPDQNSDVYIHFATGIYYYSLQQYANAAARFQQAQINVDPVFNCLVKRWLFITSYDARPQHSDGLEVMLDSYQKYIQRNRAALHHFAASFEHFTKAAKKLLQAGSKKQKQALLQQWQPQSFFTGKDWLLKKCSQ